MNKEELVKMLQSCEDATSITRDKFCVRFGIESSEFYRLTGGMRNLRTLAGIKFHWTNKQIDDNNLIDEIKRVFEQTKMPVTERMFDEKSDYSSSDVCNHFGSWKKACEIADVPYAGITNATQLYNTNCLKQVMKEMGIGEIETEKTFDGLVNPKTGKSLRYDYYIKSLNLLIEVDGFTHYDKTRTESVFGGDFAERQALDEIKNEFAKANGMNLIRVRQSDWNKVSLAELFNLENDFSFEFDVKTKQERLAEVLTRSEMEELYVNQYLSDNQIADKYEVDYNLVYRLRTEVYGIKSRSVKEQKSKLDVVKLIECYLNDVPYRFMPEICGAQNCYRKMQQILKENPSIADIKSLKKSGKAGSSQSDLKVEIFDRPPYISFAGGIPDRGNA